MTHRPWANDLAVLVYDPEPTVILRSNDPSDDDDIWGWSEAQLSYSYEYLDNTQVTRLISAPSPIQESLIRDKITDFMDLNYPCRCGDDDCPGNMYEAQQIVEDIIDYLVVKSV